MFADNLSQYENNICLITQENTLTYNEIDKICNDFIKCLPFEKQLILVKAKTNIETIIGYISLLRNNSAFIMFDADSNEELLQNVIDTYTPNFIWETVEQDFQYIYEYNNYGLRVVNTNKLDLHPDLALMLSTSGTTGSPKMVKLTKQNIDENCKSIVQYLNITESHRAITNLPLYYTYGLSILNTHLYKGASLVISNYSIMSKEFWNMFKEYEVTTFNGVPYNYEILKKIGFMKMDLPSLKYMTQAGGKLNKNLVREYALFAVEKEIKFFVMYGQTEATARISYLPIEKVLEKDASIGIPIPNGELYIKDLNSGEKIDLPNIDGELMYEGKNVMMGYATSIKDLSEGNSLNGILHTGDIARKDEDGFFYITGRLKRFIKIHGNRVGLDEIEHYLKSIHFDILCTGIDNVLMIVTKNDDIDIIKKEIIEKYGFHHSVIKIKNLDEFPITNAGKINYQQLIEEFK